MTPKIPLILKIRKTKHREIARAQDIIIEELYKIFDKAVLHGGTGIWRCYNGNRFSEDVDVYIPRDIEKINLLLENFQKRGFEIKKKKISENSMYSNLELNRVITKFEVLFKTTKGFLGEYEMINGNIKTIYTLTPEEFIKEKVPTYLKRLKIRDLYDIFFLLKYVDEKNIKNELNTLINNFKKPLDEKELKIIIIDGIVPNTDNMLLYIKRKI